MKWNVRETLQAPTDGSGGGKSGAGEPTVSSGLATPDLMASLAAAEAASSPASEPAAKPAGDTTLPGGPAKPVATPGAIVQPAAAGKPAGTPTPGEAPEARIQAAVKNARAEATREAELRYAPFKGMDPEDVKVGMELLQQLRTPGGAEQFFKELGERLNAGKVEEEAYPEADLVSKDGSAKTYTHETHLKSLDIHGRKVVAQVMKELAPFINYAKTEKARQEEARTEEDRRTNILSALAEARTFKHFTKENEPAILETLQAIPAERRRAMGPQASLLLAYNTFVDTKVFPGIDTAAEAKVRADFAKKANAASGTVHPTAPSGDAAATPIKGVSQLARHMEAMEAAATAQ